MPKAPGFKIVKGMKFAPVFDEESIVSSLEYQPADDDIFIVTYPKNGTTWTQQICILLQHGGQLPDDVLSDGLYKYSPFLEKMGASVLKGMKKPYTIKTHIEADAHPWNPNSKYIVVLRNAKDAAVSFYYHQTMFPFYGIEDMSWKDFFEYWLKGDVECGSYFDWILGWWSKRSLDNIHFVLYEDMKCNPETEITKIAEFLNITYTDEIIKNTIGKSSFSFMHKSVNEQKVRGQQSLPDEWQVEESKMKFVRKGIVGDWRNHFNADQNQRLEKLFHEKFDGTGLEHLWDNYNIFTE